jgi:hypothetical protein
MHPEMGIRGDRWGQDGDQAGDQAGDSMGISGDKWGSTRTPPGGQLHCSPVDTESQSESFTGLILEDRQFPLHS